MYFYKTRFASKHQQVYLKNQMLAFSSSDGVVRVIILAWEIIVVRGLIIKKFGLLKTTTIS